MRLTHRIANLLFIAAAVLLTTIASLSDRGFAQEERAPVEQPPAVEEIAPAEPITVAMSLTDTEGVGEAVGTVALQDTPYGLLLTPNLTGIAPGIHGFHAHLNAACGPGELEGETVPGLAAGGHFDPEETESHEGPYVATGHLGDLPPLYADATGNVVTPVLAPRLSAEDVNGRSLVVHAEGDNFADTPAALGGGGARLACGTLL
ncbi:MAG: superoxide dismutase family protein [Cyanobacteria bacterium J06554_11]